MAKLNDLQYAAIEILSQPKRGGMTYKEVAEAVGVAEQTLHRWRKDDNFDKALREQVMRNTSERFPEVMQSIPDHIIEDGNAAMFRTLLQAYGMLTEKHEVETKSNDENNVEDMRKELDALLGGNEDE